MRTATSLFAILLGVSALPKIPQAQAQTLNVLHSFTGAPDGAFPMASLVRDKESNLYGTTQGGGGVPVEKQVGTVFKLETSGNETVLHTFGESGDDGQLPVAGLVRDKAGNLYGTTPFGGDCPPCSESGTVFKLDTSGNETLLHNFTGAPDGANPFAGLIMDRAGNLYGTTAAGGSSGYGTVFKLDTSGNETVLYSVTGTPDGANPRV